MTKEEKKMFRQVYQHAAALHQYIHLDHMWWDGDTRVVNPRWEKFYNEFDGIRHWIINNGVMR